MYVPPPHLLCLLLLPSTDDMTVRWQLGSHHQVCCLVTVPTRCQLAPSPLALFSLPHPSILAALPAPLSCSCLTLPFSPHCLDLVVAFGLPCCCLLPLPPSFLCLTVICVPSPRPSPLLPALHVHPCLPPAPLPGCLPPWSLTSSQPTSPSLPGVHGCAPLLSPSPSPSTISSLL